MLVVALTGGMGAGKSTVADLLAQRGAHVLRSDDLAREVVEPGSIGLAAVVARFGEHVVHQDGSLNRARLASLVFADTDARRDLEGITHPLIRELTEARMAQAAAMGARVLIHEIPLLVEIARADDYDAVVVVEAPLDLRVQRLRARGISEDDARSRIAQQATEEQRRAVADYIINNSGDLADLQDAVDILWSDLSQRADATPR